MLNAKKYTQIWLNTEKYCHSVSSMKVPIGNNAQHWLLETVSVAQAQNHISQGWNQASALMSCERLHWKIWSQQVSETGVQHLFLQLKVTHSTSTLFLDGQLTGAFIVFLPLSPPHLYDCWKMSRGMIYIHMSLRWYTEYPRYSQGLCSFPSCEYWKSANN